MKMKIMIMIMIMNYTEQNTKYDENIIYNKYLFKKYP